MTPIQEEWALGRLKVVEDQRAADLEKIKRFGEMIEILGTTNAKLADENRRLRADLARAGLALDEATKESAMPDPSHDGAQRLHNWFGLSYASYLTLPRSILRSMPGEWQGRLVDLLAELDEAFDAVPDHGTEYEVVLKDEEGHVVEDPLANYRHPDADYIEFLRKK